MARTEAGHFFFVAYGRRWRMIALAVAVKLGYRIPALTWRSKSGWAIPVVFPRKSVS